MSTSVSVVTGAHNTCFQQVQEDMSKAGSVSKKWDFVTIGTEISVAKPKFVIEYFTPLTLGRQKQDRTRRKGGGKNLLSQSS